jgi:predicted ATP-dependent protease
MELDPDGKPKVEIFLVKTIMEALPLLFDMSEETQMDVPDGADG